MGWTSGCRSFLSQARAIADQYGVGVRPTHVRTRDPAQSILAEAARAACTDRSWSAPSGLHATAAPAHHRRPHGATDSGRGRAAGDDRAVARRRRHERPHADRRHRSEGRGRPAASRRSPRRPATRWCGSRCWLPLLMPAALPITAYEPVLTAVQPESVCVRSRLRRFTAAARPGQRRGRRVPQRPAAGAVGRRSRAGRAGRASPKGGVRRRLALSPVVANVATVRPAHRLRVSVLIPRRRRRRPGS